MTKHKGGGLRSTLRRLFSLGEPAEASPSAPTHQEHRYRAERASVPMGRLSLVGLGHVREELGDRWPALVARVHALAETVIARNLVSGDVFEVNADGDYVVLFCQLGEREAEFKVRAIAREITQRLLGSEWDKLSDVEAVSSSVSREAADADDLDGALAASFAKGTRIVSDDPEEARQRSTGDHGEEAALPSSEVLEPSIVPTKPALAMAEGSPPSPKARAISVPIGRQPPAWRYSPIWDFTHDALVHSRIVAAHETSDHDLTGAALRHVAFSSDLSALAKAATDIVRLAGLGRRLPVTCPVHAAALEFPNCRNELLHELKSLPLNVRRLLTIELIVPPGWTKSIALDQFLVAIRSLKTGVCTRLHAGTDSLSALRQLPGPVTVQLPAEVLPEGRCIKYLEAFADRALKANLECGVAGISSRSLAMAATAAGFRFLSGPAIHPEMATLDQARRFDLTQLYEDLLPRTVRT